jgi:hypothetical protein
MVLSTGSKLAETVAQRRLRRTGLTGRLLLLENGDCLEAPRTIASLTSAYASAVPRGLYIRSHMHIEQMESRVEQGNKRSGRVCPPFRRGNLLSDGGSGMPRLALAEYRLDRLSSREQTGRVCRKSAAVIASQSCWQRDQHDCNQRKKVRMKCFNRLARKLQPGPAVACQCHNRLNIGCCT